MKLLIFLILLSQVSCAASAANFLVSTSSNLFSDEVGRQIEKNTNPSDCSK